MQISTDKLSGVLRCCPHFDRLLSLCSTKDVYIVGGAIRDALIGRPIMDLDLISSFDPTSMAKLFARQIDGHWFWLDKERLQSRVVVNHDDVCFHYDFALFRAASLELDLLDRDFTINALTLPITEGLSVSSLIDPYCGLNDLQQDSLRMVCKDSFANDALRVIKGARHATALSLSIEAETLQAMMAENVRLDLVAPERVRQEIWKIFADANAACGLQLLCDCGAGEALFGSDFVCQISCLSVQVENYREVLNQLVMAHPVVNDWLTEELEQGFSRKTLLLWTLLLMNIDLELPIKLAREWRLSRNARVNITAVTALSQSACNDFVSIARNVRALAWWADRFRIDPKLLLPAMILIGLSQSTFSLEDLRVWIPLVNSRKDQRLTDLVDGHWLRNGLGLKEGPEMTKALKQLRNAEIYGQVSNKDEAMRYLAEHYQNKD